MGWEPARESAGSGWEGPVFDPGLGEAEQARLLRHRDLLWSEGELSAGGPAARSDGADDHLKAIGVLAAPTVGVAALGLFLESRSERSTGALSLLYHVAGGFALLAAVILLLCAAVLAVAMAMAHGRGAEPPLRQTLAVAAELQGRYILPEIDLDDACRALFRRAKAACTALSSSDAHAQGLIDLGTPVAVLPRLLWELAVDLAALTNQAAAAGETAARINSVVRPAADPGRGSTRAASFMAVAQRRLTLERRVALLEARARQVAALDRMGRAPTSTDRPATRDETLELPRITVPDEVPDTTYQPTQSV